MRNNENMVTYPLIIAKELHHKLKIVAANRNITLITLLVEILTNYLQGLDNA